ncbi:septum site-determining protein MinC [Oceanirhabdus sp. W0125-5]|uniref:septum site-determining protein MinC n=1 Tax=Oceanirhabdus sp. W0125-5 TaxID=2999116 RepID=UPI0022F2A7CE|nr:septum site-determining protein MinC [Oceanirhabdus sp. W0125-5]WBW95862.1 septum site-determining protein MinC [Oceanirhabdus sp. W0125-5]
MKPTGITIKGYSEGLNIVINLDAFEDERHMLHMFKGKLKSSKKFYKNSSLILTTQLNELSDKAINEIKAFLYNVLEVKECTFKEFQEFEEVKKKKFNGIYEGRTKFIRKSVRSGQVINYNGNIVIIGDVNPGAEVTAQGNIIVMGSLKGVVHAGCNGNHSAIIAAFNMQPALVRIGEYISRSPEEEFKPNYPEVVKVKNGQIIIEPYLPNKFL